MEIFGRKWGALLDTGFQSYPSESYSKLSEIEIILIKPSQS